MNSTNRFLNRLFLAVVGLLLLAAGAAAVALGAVPSITAAYKQQAAGVQQRPPTWVSDPVTGRASSLTLIIVAVALVLIILLIVFIARQGRGHTPRLVDDHVGGNSRTLIELAAPRTLLTEHLKLRADFIATRVSAYEVNHAPMLKITAQCRRGTSPADAARAITDALHAVDRILGTSTPALIQIAGGFRTRVAGSTRTVD